jgi:triacylglycerol lipase
MPVKDELTPMEASYIATNAYFTLKDWIQGTPVAGVETRANVHNRVLGPGTAGKVDPGQPNPSLAGTALGGARLGQIFSGNTGFATTGFGYVLQLKQGDRRHAVIATRGTRPELPGIPDLLTDARGAMTGFGDYGLVHKGFKRTFESIAPQLTASERVIMDADVVHCVGHSLGGAVATLVAAHYRQRGKLVKLYTFGSPRVGAFGTYTAMHGAVGQPNILRVAHDLDPISLIGPFPYIHVNPAPGDDNNMTIPSPTGQLFSTANHDMNRYIRSVGGINATWEAARGLAGRVDHDNAVLARWLLHEDNDPGWVQVASAKTLSLLFKLFAHVLRTASTSVIIGLSALDMLVEMLLSGLYKAAALGAQVYTMLRHAATWAGITMAAGAEFTAQILRRIVGAMLSRLQQIATLSLAAITHELVPLPLLVAGGWSLAQGLPL